MALKPLITDSNNIHFNEKDAINGYVDHENNLQLNTGIDIRFQDIIYRAPRHIPWDRCRSCILFHLKNEKK